MTEASGDSRAPAGDRPRRWLGVATVATVLGVLPVFCLGALSVLMAADIGLDQSRLGMGVGLFFASSALASVPAGYLSERFGPTTMLRIAGGLSAASLLSVAFLVNGWVTLLVALAAAGWANGLGQPPSDMAITRAMPAGRDGFGMGIKQAAPPMAGMIAGLGVPLLGLTLGWRSVFLIGALAGPALALLVPGRAPGVAKVRRRADQGRLTSSVGRLMQLSLAGGVQAASATAVAMFLVDSIVRGGSSAAVAGTLLAVGSVAAAGMRFASGNLADRREGVELKVCAALVAGGALGMVGLAFTPGGIVTVLAVVLAMGGGWGWPALFNLSVLRANRAAPAAAIGITQMGLWLGSAAGPLGFGFLADAAGYPTAWLCCAAGSAGSALLLRRAA